MSRPHRGVSLTELLVVMGIASTLFTIAATVLRDGQLMMRFARETASIEHSADRLGEAFRRDVSLAERAQTDDQTDTMVLLGDELGEIHYRFEEGVFSRLVYKNSAIQERESFRFNSNVFVAIETKQAPQRAVLIMQQSRGDAIDQDEKAAEGRLVAHFECVLSTRLAGSRAEEEAP